MKNCTKCHNDKPESEFTKEAKTRDGLSCWCKDCSREKSREWRRSSPHYASTEYKNTRNRMTTRIKFRVISNYNPEVKCVRCGFSDIRALTIDHVNGDGAKHREAIGNNTYQWLITNNFPSGFQVLCCNCNQIKKVENKEYGRNTI